MCAEEVSAVMFAGPVKDAGFAGQASVVGVDEFELDDVADPELRQSVEAKSLDRNVRADGIIRHEITLDPNDVHRCASAPALVAAAFGSSLLRMPVEAALHGDIHPALISAQTGEWLSRHLR